MSMFRSWVARIPAVLLLCQLGFGAVQPETRLTETHPRIFLNPAELAALTTRCAGPQAADYAALKAAADAAVQRRAIRWLGNPWAVPHDLLSCALTCLIERQAKRPYRAYADLIVATWGDGRMIADQKGSAFGYHAIAYDWIHDCLEPAQRQTYGAALGSWLTWYSGEAAITLKNGAWDYNQTWGPTHLNVMHSRDALTQKLLISLAIAGDGTPHEAEARKFLASWAERVPRECIPYFDAMGGSWSESHGHGEYGPITVVPYAFDAWRSASGQNLFIAGKPASFLPEMSRWLTWLRVPYVDRHAFIDDGGGGRFAGFANSAPLVAKDLRDPLAQWLGDQAAADGSYADSPWQRVLRDPTLVPRSPAELKLPLAYLFAGAGHVFMRSSWNDPDATWAFFGVGPHRVGHQHDDEGHFLIARRGALVSKGAGTGGNDDDDYWGGSLAFNLVTIFDPAEKPRRAEHNENDGGLLRHVYENQPCERGRITAFSTAPEFTYAAADITAGYSPQKAKEVTRQFLYLRAQNGGSDEYFVVFDRVESTKPEFAKHFMLHVPVEPTVSGIATDLVPGHVSSHTGSGLIASWLSRPDDFGPEAKVLSSGRSRLFVQTVLPEATTITVRGGAGYRNWGHPLEPSAQYDHDSPARAKPPLCDWRLEVAAPPAARVCFLHVFQLSAENVTTMAPVRLLARSPLVTIEIGAPGRVWRVTLAPQGELGGSVTTPGGSSAKRLATTVESAAQYSQWQQAVGRSR